MEKRMKRTFWFHYNKPASKAAGKPQITVHFKGKCHICDNVVCLCITEGRIRKTQPYFVMTGKCFEIRIVEGICYIK